MEELDKPANQGTIRDEFGRFPKGISGNPAGRPKGQTLKEFTREWLSSMTPEEKREFLNKLSPDIQWRMAEGNPHTTTDITSKDQQIGIPILTNALLGHDSDTQDNQPEEKD